MIVLKPYDLNCDVIVSLTDKGIELYNKYLQDIGDKEASVNKVKQENFLVEIARKGYKSDSYYQIPLREVFYIFDNKELQMHDYVRFDFFII
jgi:hypothetical protein